MVLTREEGLLLPVQWQSGRFEIIGGDGSWVEADEVERWEEPLDLERLKEERAA